jgi:hypothetical protein
VNAERSTVKTEGINTEGLRNEYGKICCARNSLRRACKYANYLLWVGVVDANYLLWVWVVDANYLLWVCVVDANYLLWVWVGDANQLMWVWVAAVHDLPGWIRWRSCRRRVSA